MYQFSTNQDFCFEDFTPNWIYMFLFMEHRLQFLNGICWRDLNSENATFQGAHFQFAHRVHHGCKNFRNRQFEWECSFAKIITQQSIFYIFKYSKTLHIPGINTTSSMHTYFFKHIHTSIRKRCQRIFRNQDLFLNKVNVIQIGEPFFETNVRNPNEHGPGPAISEINRIQLLKPTCMIMCEGLKWFILLYLQKHNVLLYLNLISLLSILALIQSYC